MTDFLTKYNEDWSKRELQKVGLRMLRSGMKKVTSDQPEPTYRIVSDVRMTMTELRHFLYEGGAR